MNNIILIGMPASGKTVVGEELADTLSCSWIDTDDLIEQKIKMKISEYLKQNTADDFKKIEEEILLKLNCKGKIISTGGSAIYSERGMENLRHLGDIVYLEIDYPTIEKRILESQDRGIIGLDNNTLKDLYDQRLPLYRKWADHKINTNEKSVVDVALEIIGLI